MIDLFIEPELMSKTHRPCIGKAIGQLKFATVAIVGLLECPRNLKEKAMATQDPPLDRIHHDIADLEG